MADIFISYSRQDRERVRPIADALEQAGYDIWWDIKIPTGTEFDHAIDKALRDAKAVLVVWSENSVNSRWVKEEAEDGLTSDRLVPVLLDPVAIPRGFRRIQASDFSAGGATTQAAAWRELRTRLDALIGGEEHDLKGPPPPQRSSRWWWAGLGAVALAILAGLWWLTMRPAGPTSPPPPADMTPVVIGIYPTDSFGPLQKRGLHLALESQAPGTSLIDLEAPIDAMKRRQAPEVIASLATALRDRNVIAVVGPSVTEFAPQVIAAIAESGRRPALLLTTAGPRRAIGWDGSDLPIFRVGSGVDERARQFADLATGSIAAGRKIVFLVERTANDSGQTYGELFFHAISQYLPQWSAWFEQGRISRVNFERGRAVESLQALERANIFDGDNVVFVLGLGSDYAALATAFYKAADPRRRAALGGWMTAYAVGPIFAERPMQYDRLFDISDVWRAPADRENDTALRVFRREYGDVTPARRDETVTYDSGLVIAAALAAVGPAVDPEAVVAYLRGRRFRGIAGDIMFGANGQNEGPVGGIAPLNIVRFDPAARDWVRLPSVEPILAAPAERAPTR